MTTIRGRETHDGDAVIAVLGAKVGGRALARRIEQAAGEYDDDAWFIACGGRRWDGVVEADAIADGLVARGVPRRRIVCDRLSLTTVENLREARTIVAMIERHAREGASLGVVTCDWHLPRALRIARALGLRAHGIAARSPDSPLHRRLLRRAWEHATWACDRATLAYAARGET